MEAVGNLARLHEEYERHKAAVEKALAEEPADVCTECGRPLDPDAT